MSELTAVQKKTLDFILSHIESTGIPPTLREIANYFQWKAVGSAQDVVSALRKKGVLLNSTSGKARQIVPAPEIYGGLFQAKIDYSKEHHKEKKSTKTPFTPLQKISGPFLPGFEEFIRVPLLGMVQAGNPSEAIEQQQHDYVAFPPISRASLRNSSLFALTVEGFSMLFAGFLPGDTILVEANQSPNDKEIVVACVNHTEVTVKRFAKYGSTLYKKAEKELRQTPPAFLMPENPEFSPIPFGNREDDRIIGVVRSLFRKEID
jgi:repressor LexA